MLDRIDLEAARHRRHRRPQRGLAVLRRAARAGARGRLSRRRRRQHRARPDQPSENPQVTPVQGVDEEAVRQQSAPGSEQGGRAEPGGAPPEQHVAHGRSRGSPRSRPPSRIEADPALLGERAHVGAVRRDRREQLELARPDRRSGAPRRARPRCAERRSDRCRSVWIVRPLLEERRATPSRSRSPRRPRCRRRVPASRVPARTTPPRRSGSTASITRTPTPRFSHAAREYDVVTPSTRIVKHTSLSRRPPRSSAARAAHAARGSPAGTRKGP